MRARVTAEGFRKQTKLSKYSQWALRQLTLQIMLVLIGLTTIFPILWIVAIALDERGLPQYSELLLLPKTVSFNAFESLLFEPFKNLSSATNSIYFTNLLSNSLFVALGTAMISVGLGASAAYAFSRFKFIGRQAGMLGFIVLLMMPATGTLVPLIAIFSLLRIHVFFSAIAPSIFYGILVALISLGLIQTTRSLFRSSFFAEANRQWIPLVLIILFVFGINYLGWSLIYLNSSQYNEMVRLPLRETNVIEDQLTEYRKQVPKIEDNIVRNERQLDQARRDAERLSDELDNASTVLPGVYELYTNLSLLTAAIGQSATASQPPLINQVYDTNDVQSVIEVGIQGTVVAQEERIEDFKEELNLNEQAIEDTKQALAEARAPYYELRDKALGKLFPYALRTFAITLMLGLVVWVISGVYRMKAGSLIRRERLSTILLIGYILIITVVAYSWFNVNYKSPTKEAGLENGGLLYDMRIAFRSEDDIREALAPYTERDRLETSQTDLETLGLTGFIEKYTGELDQLNALIDRLEAIDAEIEVPDNLDRTEKIEYKDRVRNETRIQLNAVKTDYDALRRSLGQNQLRGNLYYNQINSDLSKLGILNNENFKTELSEIMRARRQTLTRELQLSDVDSLEAALANYEKALQDLPDSVDERERLIKEFAIRSSNSGNVTETLKITLFGLIIAYGSSALPFAIWNLKGYFDTIPKDLEEAALVDGANLISTFVRIILPLSLPALAITTLFGFMTGWTEFILATQFLTAGDVDRTTLAIALRGIAGGGQTQAEPDYTEFAAMSIMMAIPVVTLFYVFQRWIVSGLTVGGVKG